MAFQLGRLNSRQREAVLHGNGPLLILAGAGSGKTSTMAYRIAHLISERNLPATDILGLSFTNKAARELRERVIGLVSKTSGIRAARGLTITTFHSLCARLLRTHADLLGFQKNFTILDQNDQTDILKQVLRNIHIDDKKFDADVILFEIGQAKNRFLQPDVAESFFLESGRLSSDYAIAAASSFSHYQDQLRVLNAMDFDDLIYYAVRLLEHHASVRDYYNARFRHILVDEYQDTNAVQFKILKLLTERQQNLCVVGDDDQSIYAWRGADPSHILGFEKHFPEARTITLDQNYRSTSRILEAANHVIEKNRNRFPKKLWSDRGEGEPVTEVILEEDRAEADFVGEELLRRSSEQSRLWSDFAVLYRSNAQSRVFEEALRRRSIPYKIVGGLSFLARKEVKNVLAYWRLISNPKDDASLRRVINWPARGIGKVSIENLGKFAFEKQIALYDALSEAPKIAVKAAPAIQGFQRLLHYLREKLQSAEPSAAGLSNWARESLTLLQIRAGLEGDSDDPVQVARKWENVEELVHSLGQFKFESEGQVQKEEDPGQKGSELSESLELQGPQRSPLRLLQEFLNRMMLEAQEAEKDEESKDKDKNSKKNEVTLLTLHGAKGLEFPFVFLVGMEEGFLPHKRTLDEATDLSEERRLCYVGITRAKDFLFLLRTKTRIRWGKPVPRNPSRFLEEIPKDLLVTEDLSTCPGEPPLGAEAAMKKRDEASKEAQKAHETKVKDYLAQIRANLMRGTT